LLSDQKDSSSLQLGKMVSNRINGRDVMQQV
jgi:hypothetical protein